MGSNYRCKTGKKNISDVDCCATRLRVTVFDPSKVIDDTLKQSGAAGIIKKGNGIQVIYGPKVTVIKSRLENYLQNPISDDEESVTVKEVKTKENKKEEKKEDVKESSGIFTDKVYVPIKGTIVQLESVKDEAFSSGAMGKGIAIDPKEGKVYAPFDGIIETAFPTKHAIGLTSDKGVELLIHVGMDTVKLGGTHFISHIEDGQKVKKGELLLEFNVEKIREEGYPTLTPVIVTNCDDYKEIIISASGSADVGEDLIEIKN